MKKTLATKGMLLPILMGLSANAAFASNTQTNTISLQAKSSTSYLPSKYDLLHGHAVVQLGGYWSIQGKSQHINIEGLIGDTFTVTKDSGSNGLVGFGYFVDGPERGRFDLSYGINAFYMPKTSVSGYVTQEGLFNNLAYGYNTSHFPVYAMAKSTIDLKSPNYALTLDVGIGPNFMKASGFKEYSLDGGVTLPDNIFSSRTSTLFSATAGIGLIRNHVFGNAPLECGYRFFYLGDGANFNNTTNQVLSTFSTGPMYANAIVCGVTVG
jgi:hypothetical protein